MSPPGDQGASVPLTSIRGDMSSRAKLPTPKPALPAPHQRVLQRGLPEPLVLR